MKVVTITINKGGVGKTMISRSLGTAAAAAGKLVLILDMDTQQNSTNWRRRRPDELSLPHVQFTTENDVPDTLKRAEEAGCDLVLIDTPPGRSTEAVAAVEEADLVIIPCTSETECFEGLPRTAGWEEGGRGREFHSPIGSRGRGNHSRGCQGARPRDRAHRVPRIPGASRRQLSGQDGAGAST